MKVKDSHHLRPDTRWRVADIPIVRAGRLREVTDRRLKPGRASLKAIDKPNETVDIRFEMTDTPNEAADTPPSMGLGTVRNLVYGALTSRRLASMSVAA